MADEPRDRKLDETRDIKVDAPPKKSRWRVSRWTIALMSVLLVPLVVFGLWVAITLGFSFSEGERVGYLQKFSRNGWLCKTWEGELAMSNIPGAMPELFQFSVRDDDVAAQLRLNQGKRVAISYDQHRGVPTNCFGETEYFATGVRSVPTP